MRALLQEMRVASEELTEDAAELTEELVPIGAIRLRKGAWWKKISTSKWKLARHTHQRGIEVSKHATSQPIQQRWEKRQGL